MNNDCRMKYWSWITVFSVSILFWAQIVWMLCR
ncbi:small membrane protein YmiC [Kosakonia oryziphila]|nr:small membrane protein YmiC [Kosakonia oryziphila]